jgi:hypothetical protein
MLFGKRLLKVTAQHGMSMAWHVWITTDRPETACGRPARFLASSGYHAEFHVGCYQKHTTPLNYQFEYFRLPRELLRRTRHCRRMSGARHAMCELTRHGMAGERHGRGMSLWISLNCEIYQAKARFRCEFGCTLSSPAT